MNTQLASILFLATCFLAAALGLAWAQRRSRLSVLQGLYWWLAWLLVKFLWRCRWLNPFPLPADQGAVLVCNHRSSVDPFFIQSATERKVHWMVAKEYCQHPLFGPPLRVCEVIPISRGGVDTGGTRAAIQLAAAGGLVGMFPEGRINMTEDFMLPGRPGAALVALKARAKIVPCYVAGSPYDRKPWSPFFMPARVTVRFGEPLDLSEYFGREQEAGVLEEIILKTLAALAALAGQADHQPRIAGRNWKPTSEELEADMAASVRRRNR